MPVDPFQLLDRMWVVVDAEIDGDVAFAAVAAVLADDEERGRLPPAPIPPGEFRRRKTVEQALAERPCRRSLERRRQSLDRRR